MLSKSMIKRLLPGAICRGLTAARPATEDSGYPRGSVANSQAPRNAQSLQVDDGDVVFRKIR